MQLCYAYVTIDLTEKQSLAGRLSGILLLWFGSDRRQTVLGLSKNKGLVLKVCSYLFYFF